MTQSLSQNSKHCSGGRHIDEIGRDTIDFTRLSIATALAPTTSFSVVVIGDTDAGLANAQLPHGACAELAEQMLQKANPSENALLLHTGDLTYPIGSYENYLSGFLQPYGSLLSQVPKSPAELGRDVVFNQPFLPVPGNHDYGQIRRGRFMHRLLRAFCDRLRQVGIDLGHYGGEGGEAYTSVFLDSLEDLTEPALKQHLVNHYSAPVASCSDETATSRYCLNYHPGQFTRLPNRYYQFRYAGVDFFALDSNTWNTPSDAENFDYQQLEWLEQALVASWQADTADNGDRTVARIVYLHHSPYTTEESRWQQPETLWVRRHLRSVLDRVAAVISGKNCTDGSDQISPIDLVVSGHAHCMEHIKTADTGHADSHLDWIVCGGSGMGIRRQRKAGADILETIVDSGHKRTSIVASSRLYAGAHGHGQKKQNFHSFIQIKIQPESKNKITILPFVVQHQASTWHTRALSPITIEAKNAQQSVDIPNKAA